MRFNIPRFGKFQVHSKPKYSTRTRITLIKIVVKMDKMKNIPNFMLNNVLLNHFPKKLDEKSYSALIPKARGDDDRIILF